MSKRQDDALPVVAWMESWPDDQIRPAGRRVFTEPPQMVDWNGYDDLVRLSDAQSAIASLQKDAARYRWLRDEDDDTFNLATMFVAAGATADDVDAAIDRARGIA